MIKLFLLGAPLVEADGAAVPIARRKTLALLAYLAVEARPQRRDTLATLLWPADDQSAARANLRRALSELTGALGGDLFQADRETIALTEAAAGGALWIDAAALRAAADPASPPTGLAAVAELYRGDFMAGFSLRDSPAFDEWQFFQAEEARLQITSILERLVADPPAAGDSTAGGALWAARRLVALNPLDEAHHRRLMELLERGGHHSAALRQYEDCRRILAAELGLEPQPETTALYEQIRAGALRRAAPATPANGAPIPRGFAQAPAGGRPLPTPTTPFFGRERELAFIADCLADPQCRLLTLLGSGGIGKTRLALQAAHEYAARAAPPPSPAAPINFVPCVALQSAEDLIVAISDALGTAFYGEGAPLDHLTAHLRKQPAILVLDNVEQLTQHAEVIAALLAGAPGLKILTTSRERLQLSNEWILTLEGLPLPDSASAEEFRRWSAAQIFEQSARRVSPAFQWTEDTIAAVRRICALVEGIPLAIELAGGWVRALSCAEIAAEIERCLGFLTSPLRDLPERHRSLRAVFERSWRLLPADEQAAFRKLAIFRNGFSHQAAAAVADAGLETLAAFLDKSLLRRTERGRYESHEFIRQYAEEQLAPDEHSAVAARHYAYYAALLREHGDRRGRGGEPSQIRLTADEAENIRAAWRWALDEGGYDLVEGYSHDLFNFYNDQGWYLESREVFAQAIAALQKAGGPARLLGKLHNYQGHSSLFLGFYGEARALFKTSVRLLEGEDAIDSLAKALNNQAYLELSVGHYSDAKAMLRESLELCRAHGVEAMEAKALNLLGYILGNEGDFAQAQQLLEASIAINRRGGNFHQVGHVLNSLGYVLMVAGKYDQALARFEESLDLLQHYGTPSSDAVVVVNMGYLAVKRGEYARARGLFLAALETILTAQAAPLALDVFAGLALLAFQQGDYGRARDLLRLPLTHPARWQETLLVTEELRANLEARLVPVEYAGECPEWQTVAGELLAEQSEADLAPHA